MHNTEPQPCSECELHGAAVAGTVSTPNTLAVTISLLVIWQQSCIPVFPHVLKDGTGPNALRGSVSLSVSLAHSISAFPCSRIPKMEAHTASLQ